MMGILEFDTLLFQCINGDLTNPFFDWLLPIMRNKLTWIPVYIGLVSYIIWKRQKWGWILLFLFMGVGISDYTSSTIIKKSVERVRPCNTGGLEVIERVHCGGGYSFTSSHATNHFFISCYLAWVVFLSRKSRFILLAWAGIVSISQVYVGVHYPLDVLSGGGLGTFIAYLMYLAYANVLKKKYA